jgi:betaine-aldehyde dehydrogenase
MEATTEKKLARHWIDGAWVDSATHRESFNPATGEVIGSYADGEQQII